MMAQANLARALTQHFPDVRIVGTTGSVRETVLWPAHAGEQCRCDFHGRGALRRGLLRDIPPGGRDGAGHHDHRIRQLRRAGVRGQQHRLPAQTDRPRGAAACRGALPGAERGYRPRRIAERNPQPARIQTALCRAFQRPDRSGTNHRHRLFLLGREKHLPCHERQQPAMLWISRSTSFRTNWIPVGFSAYRAAV